jgi:drug/metabolite transporter superfamily protein YnfA
MSKHAIHNTATPKKKHMHKLGASLSLLCGIHCLLTPFVVTAMPFAGKEILGNEAIEAVIMFFSVGLAAFMLIKDSLKLHGKYSALMLLVAGISILFYNYFSHTHDHSGVGLLSAFGGIIIFAAFVLNWHLGRRYHSCEVHS